MVRGQTETAGISVIDPQYLRWSSTSLLHSRAHQCATAKVYVFSDSALCLERTGDNPSESWKNQIHWYSENNYFNDRNRIDGKPMEFEWKIFPGHTNAGILKEIQKTIGELQCDPANFTSSVLHVDVQRHVMGEKRK